jgi:hypothetical protein
MNATSVIILMKGYNIQYIQACHSKRGGSPGSIAGISKGILLKIDQKNNVMLVTAGSKNAEKIMIACRAGVGRTGKK